MKQTIIIELVHDETKHSTIELWDMLRDWLDITKLNGGIENYSITLDAPENTQDWSIRAHKFVKTSDLPQFCGKCGQVASAH